MAMAERMHACSPACAHSIVESRDRVRLRLSTVAMELSTESMMPPFSKIKYV
jgi:hypothetical protein